MKLKHLRDYFLIAVGIIVLDQIIKVIVHTSMIEDEHFQVLGDFFKIHYTTNPGMAFGIELGGTKGKMFLTIFRLIAMVGIGYYLTVLYKKEAPKGLLICVAMILGGAVGNVIDSTFYGVWFDLTVQDAPTPWFHGKVVDMFYIDIAQGYYPQWMPLVGGDYYSFWPIFNIADASIFIAVILIIVYQKRFFNETEEKKEHSL